jgi:hypothetical protein
MTATPMSASRFANKVHCEGGIVEALEYGLTVDDLDPDDPRGWTLRQAWGELADLWAEMSPVVERVDYLLGDLLDADEDDE